MPPQFQIGVELTNVFPTIGIVAAGLTAVMNYARDLRKSGSDLLVENDLAAIFGRGRINRELLTRFKGEVLKDVSMKPLYPGCEINLAWGPGPTVNHAIASEDRYYLSSVIQLSLLAWFHQRTSLASALTECIAERFRQDYPGSNPDPGFDGIEGTLQAISSQTSAFLWSDYARAVENKLKKCYPEYNHNLATWNELNDLTPNALLGAMDMLYLVQSLPDDRRMIVKGHRGIITLIIWAHFTLSLNVVIRGIPTGEINFGEGPAQVIIIWDPSGSAEHADVCLLDAGTEILWTIEPETLNMKTIAGEERQTLRNYGTTWLRKKLSMSRCIEDDDPLYENIVSHATAISICMAAKLCRNTDEADFDTQNFKTFPLERWRIIDAVGIMFEDISVNIKDVDVKVAKGLEDLYFGFLREDGTSLYSDLDDGALTHLITLILAFSNISKIKDCACLPLVVDMQAWSLLDTYSYLQAAVTQKGSIESVSILEDDAFTTLSILVFGQKYTDNDSASYSDAYIVSSFGWSVVLDIVGDKDPADVKPWLIHIRKGVPTNGKTGERKLLLKDFNDAYEGTAIPALSVYDTSGSFQPRCVDIITRRIEYFTSRRDAFFSILRLDGREIMEKSMVKTQHQPEFIDGSKFEVTAAYRALHRCLWKTCFAPGCQHPVKNLHIARLSDGAVTINTFGIAQYEKFKRTLVVLVKGDKRSRWIALQEASKTSDKKVMLRGRNTCEDCAIDFARSLPGRWVVIL